MTGTPFEFSEATIRERFLDHWEFAEAFLEAYLTSWETADGIANAQLSISKTRLFFAVSSAYQDIARYKNYHQPDPENQRLDATKRCAFLIKWLLRFRPINLVTDVRVDEADPVALDLFELVNENFAIFVAETHLSAEIQVDFIFSEAKRKELLYKMLYRDVGVDGWMSFFQLVKECFPNYQNCGFIVPI